METPFFSMWVTLHNTMERDFSRVLSPLSPGWLHLTFIHVNKGLIGG